MDRPDEDDGGQTQDLVERLARRFSDPVGVIDVRFAEQKYARIVGWLAARFALLDQLRARYGSDEGISDDWQNMTMQQHPGEQTNLFSTTGQSFLPAFLPAVFPATAERPGNDRVISSEAAASLAEIRAQNRAADLAARSIGPDESLSTPEPKYRISRRHQPIASSSRTSSSEDHSQRAGKAVASEPDSQKAAEPIKQFNDVYRESDVPLVTSFVFAKPLSEPKQQSHSDAPKKLDSQSPESAIDSAVSSLEPPEQRRDTSLPLSSARVEPSKQQGNTSLPSPSPQGDAFESTRYTSIPMTSPRSEPSVARDTALPLANPSVELAEHTRDTSLPLARSWADSERADNHKQTGARSLYESAPPAQDTREIAVASEVRNVPGTFDGALSGALPDIVWRNGREPNGMIYSGSFERGRGATDPARQVNNSAGSPITQQTNQKALPENLQPRDESRKDEIQIEQLSPQIIRTISERVIRTISLDLKIERERRGISKWR